MSPDMRSRRCKLFVLGDQTILSILRHSHDFRSGKRPHDGWMLPVFSGDLPTDAVFQDAYYEPLRSCWMLRVSHPSWEEIELGREIPVVMNDRIIQLELDPRYRERKP